GASTVLNSPQAAACTSRRKPCSSGKPCQPSFTVILRPSASVNEAMSSALPNACSEMLARGLPFIPRHEYAEICRISATGEPNQRIAAGCTAPLLQRWCPDTSGHATVAGGLTATAVKAAAPLRDGA